MNDATYWHEETRRLANDGHAGLLARLFAASPALVWAGIALLLLSVPTLVLSWYDPRTLLGVSVWLKPWKFQVSTGSYLLTLVWIMVGLSPQQRRAASLSSTSTVGETWSMLQLIKVIWSTWSR